jgi:hypothetical protein
VVYTGLNVSRGTVSILNKGSPVADGCSIFESLAILNILQAVSVISQAENYAGLPHRDVPDSS